MPAQTQRSVKIARRHALFQAIVAVVVLVGVLVAIAGYCFVQHKALQRNHEVVAAAAAKAAVIGKAVVDNLFAALLSVFLFASLFFFFLFFVQLTCCCHLIQLLLYKNAGRCCYAGVVDVSQHPLPVYANFLVNRLFTRTGKERRAHIHTNKHVHSLLYIYRQRQFIA